MNNNDIKILAVGFCIVFSDILIAKKNSEYTAMIVKSQIRTLTHAINANQCFKIEIPNEN